VRARALAGLWLVVGVVVWNAFFDLYVARGAQQYLQAKAEYDLGVGPAVNMAVKMREVRRHATLMSSVWAGLVMTCGLATVWLMRASTSHPASPAPHSAPPTPHPASRTPH
jgi:hypothetical protein